jgi:hypothetical protein
MSDLIVLHRYVRGGRRLFLLWAVGYKNGKCDQQPEEEYISIYIYFETSIYILATREPP